MQPRRGSCQSDQSGFGLVRGGVEQQGLDGARTEVAQKERAARCAAGKYPRSHVEFAPGYGVERDALRRQVRGRKLADLTVSSAPLGNDRGTDHVQRCPQVDASDETAAGRQFVDGDNRRSTNADLIQEAIQDVGVRTQVHRASIVHPCVPAARRALS